MAVVLLLLVAGFSLATIQDQPATGMVAAEALAERMVADWGKGAAVAVAAAAGEDDALFADQVAGALRYRELQVVSVVKGSPRDARQALEKAPVPAVAVACTETAAKWLIWKALPQVKCYQPVVERWPSFLLRSNLINIANQIAVIAIVAIGMTMVIITGGIDLSVGSLIALSAVITARIIRDWMGGVDAGSLGMLIAAGAGVGFCAVAGWLNGWFSTRFGLPSFIVTLAMMLVASGMAYRLADHQSIYQVPDSFVWLGRASWGWLPVAVVLMLVLYLAAQAFMKHTAAGRHLYAVGGNADAARLSGLRVDRVQTLAFAVSGALAGLGGVILASQLKGGSPTYGQMYELHVIAAVVVGGASLNGGRGKMFGTLIGAFIIAVIQNGMNLLNIESATQKVVLGLIILAAVLLDRVKWWRNFSS